MTTGRINQVLYMREHSISFKIKQNTHATFKTSFKKSFFFKSIGDILSILKTNKLIRMI